MRGRERAHRKTRTRAWRRGSRGLGGGATLSGGASGGDEAASQASSATFSVTPFLFLSTPLEIRRRTKTATMELD